MTSVTCPACNAANDPAARFCAQCGAGLPVAGAATAAGPSGWDLAAAGMSQPAGPAQGPSTIEKGDYAPWVTRLGAFILDGVILAVIGVVLGIAGALVWHQVDPAGLSDTFDQFAGDLDRGPLDDGADYAWLGGWYLASAGVGLIWEALWLRSRFMGKPGQRAAGFRVTDAKGARLSTGRAFGRAFSKLLYSVPNLSWLTLIVSAIMIGANGKRRALHDVVAGTVCIKNDEWERLASGDGTVTARPVSGSMPGDAPAVRPAAPHAPAPPPLPKRPPSDGPFI